jgi:hypothetical protein
LVAYLQSTTDLAIVEILVEQFHRAEPTLFQCHKVALNALRIAHAEVDAAKPKWFRYIMRDSINALWGWIFPICPQHTVKGTRALTASCVAGQHHMNIR